MTVLSTFTRGSTTEMRRATRAPLGSARSAGDASFDMRYQGVDAFEGACTGDPCAFACAARLGLWLSERACKPKNRLSICARSCGKRA